MSLPAFSRRNPTLGYVAPFVAYICLMQAERSLGVPPLIGYPLRCLIVTLVLWIFSKPYVSLRPSMPLASIGVGIAVFAIWIGPDLVFGYRHHWLFENFITGTAGSTVPDGVRQSVAFAVWRTLGSTALVPVLEELFWRGWLMRWLIDTEFLKVPLGKYAPFAFWMVAILFASEHGVYWEVGLAAGVIYNWWLIRSRNLADCILAHAVTNGLLSVYVLAAGQWQYWL